MVNYSREKYKLKKKRHFEKKGFSKGTVRRISIANSLLSTFMYSFLFVYIVEWVLKPNIHSEGLLFVYIYIYSFVLGVISDWISGYSSVYGIYFEKHLYLYKLVQSFLMTIVITSNFIENVFGEYSIINALIIVVIIKVLISVITYTILRS